MRDAEKRMARKARRDAGNEAVLIWALLGSFASIALIIADPRRLFGGFGLPQWALLGFALAAIVAYLWYLYARKDIQQAQMDYNDIMKDKKAAQREAHLTTLKQRNS
ncbi:MAG: hypothetical protein Q9M48_09355 [Rhodobacterales bacterium]|nr:hypothetical protein [Rhodobacterales bacterium]